MSMTMSTLPNAPTREDRRDRQAPQNNNVKGMGTPRFRFLSWYW